MASEVRKRRVLFVGTHPVQYGAPIFRRMAADPRLEIKVAYLGLAGATPALDAGFGATFRWDIPLLDGYPWVVLPARAGAGLRRLLDESRWDALVLHTGYRHRVFWSALFAAKRRGIPVLFGTDATSFETQQGGRYRPRLKRLVLPWIFRLADVAIVPSTRSRDFLLEMGRDAQRVVVTPYVVDNDWWQRSAATADRAGTRRRWAIPLEAAVVLFCAKLQPWKRPGDLLEAFSRLPAQGSYLVYVGDGPLKSSLEAAALAAGLNERVRFLGFANQSELPALYAAADIFVLPSSYEPFGVVVNEAMLCGCSVVVSDKVGAAGDLVMDGETGVVYPAGDVAALTDALNRLLDNGTLRARLRRAGTERVAEWGPLLNIDRLVDAIDRSNRAPG